MSDETQKAIAEQLKDLNAALAETKAEMEATKLALLERRRDRVLEVALRLRQADATCGVNLCGFKEFVADAVTLIAEVERQVTL